MCMSCGCGKKKGEPGFGKGPRAKKATKATKKPAAKKSGKK